MYSYAIGITLNILELVLFITGAYYTVVALFSLFSARRIPREAKPVRFAAVVPAHNEGNVLPSLISSIKAADYPQELISIFVIADGCSDNTAYTAKQMGAVVLEKPTASCKGDALRYAFNYLQDSEFDCVAVFDADNIVDKNFFREMNEHISLGEKAVQGYIDSKNPNASWVANAHSLWYWLTNRIMQAGRSSLNLGCRIGGTGFALTKEALNSVPWKTETIAEDAEYTCSLALHGIKVSYAKQAVVFDEKPVIFAQSVLQRKRWTQGIRDVQGEYTPKLIRSGRLNGVLGLWGDFLYPFTFVLLLLAAICGTGGIFSSAAGKAVIWFYVATNIIIAISALIIDKKINFKTVLNTFGFVLYIISWLPVGCFGIFSRDSRMWYHTKHGNENQK